MNRRNNIRRLREEEFDLCIIGGGASGAGCAFDAALRGLKVALIEKTDFAAETSSKSTKLIHGGVRYLEQAFKKFDFDQLRQVRHGLEERHILLQQAPHLARPLALITPVFNTRAGLYYSIGLKLYDWFASGRDTLPGSRWLSKKEARSRVPGLTDKVHSAVLYYDGQLDDARYCLTLVVSAAEAGAVVANHIELESFEKSETGVLHAAIASDQQDGGAEVRIRAKVFLNCTGPFSDRLRSLANTGLPSRIRPSKGVHVVLPHEILGGNDALLIPKTKDGRVVFAIPFEGKLLLGTTDRDCNEIDREPLLEAAEVDFLLDTLQPFLSNKLNKNMLLAGFGGLRPLIAAVGGETKSLLRDHEVEHDPESNLLSLLGGKWTTYRLMAKDAVDAVCKLLSIPVECSTQSRLLAGAEDYDAGFWKKIQANYGLDADISQHLAFKYGTRANRVAELAKAQPALRERILSEQPFIKAEIIYAVREEMACTPRDFLARRIRLEITGWQAAGAASEVVATLMGTELGWREDKVREEMRNYQILLDRFRESATG
ncbi:MAG: FAD-dependent oxidoreductase [Saprospiraceae bacterium]|nr:FAD-dependent oxidoreductase [Saprospiraceae bacterium]